MKKYFGITGTLIMLANSFNAYGALSGKPDGSSSAPSQLSTNPSSEFQGRALDVTEVETVKCGTRKNSVTYKFIDSIASNIKYKFESGKLHVSIPEYYSACIGDINIKSTVGPDNNVYIRFEVDPGPKMSGSSEEFEKNYQNCIQKNYSDIGSWAQADAASLIRRKSPSKAITLTGVDASRDSRVIIGSPNSVTNTEDGYNNPVVRNETASLPVTSDGLWSCMRFETPKEESIMVNRTEGTRLNQRAELLCKSSEASLADVDALLDQMREKDTGNLSAMIKVLESVKNKLLDTEIEESIKTLTEIEDKFVPDDDDDDDVGVSKKEAKKLAKEYQVEMKKFNTEILPAIKEELKQLFIKRDDTDDTDAIDERISELNEKIALYIRNESDNSDSFISFKDGLKKYNLKKVAKDVFKAVTSAKYFAQVYEGERDERGKKLSLSEAQKKSDSAVRTVTKELFSRWDEERDLKKGKRDPINRRKKAISAINKKGRSDYSSFSQNRRARDQYMQKYLQKMVKHYCGSGGSAKNCNYMRTQYAPAIGRGYTDSRAKKDQEYQRYWGNKYGSAIESQNKLIGKYEGMYRNSRLQLMQDQSSRRTSGNFMAGGDFDFWLGDNEYQPMDSFMDDMSFMPQMPSMSQMPQFPQRQPAGNQPGSGMFSNPYYRPR